MVEPQQRAWCFFRNVVHATYREIRHIGPLTDSDAKLHVSDRKYVSAAERCSKGREVLKRADLFQQTADARTVDEVLQCYYDATHLHLQDLITLFGRHGWSRSYGGQKWATIASTALELAEALRSGQVKDYQSPTYSNVLHLTTSVNVALRRDKQLLELAELA